MSKSGSNHAGVFILSIIVITALALLVGYLLGGQYDFFSNTDEGTEEAEMVETDEQENPLKEALEMVLEMNDEPEEGGSVDIETPDGLDSSEEDLISDKSTDDEDEIEEQVDEIVEEPTTPSMFKEFYTASVQSIVKNGFPIDNVSGVQFTTNVPDGGLTMDCFTSNWICSNENGGVIVHANATSSLDVRTIHGTDFASVVAAQRSVLYQQYSESEAIDDVAIGTVGHVLAYELDTAYAIAYLQEVNGRTQQCLATVPKTGYISYMVDVATMCTTMR